MPKITKARGATSVDDGSHVLTVPDDPQGDTPVRPPAADPLPDRPAVKAKIAVWRDYAERVGVDSSGTKAQIIARVEGAG